jgi:hypothetical protein
MQITQQKQNDVILIGTVKSTLVCTVGPVQTDSESWLGLVPGCFQACKAFFKGENSIISDLATTCSFYCAVYKNLQCWIWQAHHHPNLEHHSDEDQGMH